jgi:hypothetical protein
MSRIDAPAPDAVLAPGTASVAGIAFAGSRGIQGLVFSSALSTYSSAQSGRPCHRQAYRSNTGPAKSSKFRSRGKIHDRYRQGRKASCVSTRQMAVREGASSSLGRRLAISTVSSLRL